MKTSPTQRSKKALQEMGFTVAITERWNPFARIRQDLFGFCDMLAIDPFRTIAVQTTTAGNLKKRCDKIIALPAACFWLTCGARKIVVHGWKKSGARGKKKTWSCRTIHIKVLPTGKLFAIEI